MSRIIIRIKRSQPPTKEQFQSMHMQYYKTVVLGHTAMASNKRNEETNNSIEEINGKANKTRGKHR